MSDLKHLFQTRAHNLPGLLEGVSSLKGYMNNLNAQAEISPDTYDPFKYKGDGFEWFVEGFIRTHLFDERVGIHEYSPVEGTDTGVDGVGLNIRGEKCVIQCKYKSNITQQLTANQDHLGNMFSCADIVHNVVTDREDTDNYRHFVFTTGEGLHFFTDHEMYRKRVKCYGFHDLKKMVDGVLPFWNELRRFAGQKWL